MQKYVYFSIYSLMSFDKCVYLPLPPKKTHFITSLQKAALVPFKSAPTFTIDNY